MVSSFMDPLPKTGSMIPDPFLFRNMCRESGGIQCGSCACRLASGWSSNDPRLHDSTSTAEVTAACAKRSVRRTCFGLQLVWEY
ncbi:hypothetical protein M758_4G042400 [Ceratodon purpureus]|nr:hypothetical protein M758_4G042400 [Ceratodon purpureus]